MKFHKVEVDNEVFEYVKRHAEPLTDTFNSALKRLLLAPTPGKQKDFVPHKNSLIPNLTSQIPQALRQILEVACLVRSGAYDRREATRFVAKQHNVAYQTVIDKYCRQLNLKAVEFDLLLEQPDLTELKSLLKTRYSDYEHVIEEALG